eukprot:8039436-Pyramimonas_sp.AAC.1
MVQGHDGHGLGRLSCLVEETDEEFLVPEVGSCLVCGQDKFCLRRDFRSELAGPARVPRGDLVLRYV